MKKITEKKKTIFGKKKTISYGWVGTWRDDTLGWVLPKRLSFPPNLPSSESLFNMRPNDKLILCKITVEVMPNAKGKPITRTATALLKR